VTDGKRLLEILEQFRDGRLGSEEALKRLAEFHYIDLGCAKLDTHREMRVGYPEVIYCQGKTAEQVATIVGAMLERDSNILATRASSEQYEAVRALSAKAVYNPLAKTITVRKKKIKPPKTYIAVVTAGTSDLPVAEEAAVTAEFFGNRVERVVDVGVAGIHRLFDNMQVIRGARVVIVVAGMEGALPSIVGGLVDKPVIAVPTSVGYGASFQGLSALLTMLNSCASGVSVVNIDNGYGAGYMASMINRL
jgi:NCAIR mutase (PurE)-related protein